MHPIYLKIEKLQEHSWYVFKIKKFPPPPHRQFIHRLIIHFLLYFQVKPISEESWWRRLRVSTAGNITLRSRKLQWWVITLDLEGVANPIHRTSSASFRVATKWDLSRGEYRNKRKMQLGDATEGRVHWHVNYNLPEVEGSFGADSRERSQEMHAEVGYAHAEVSKLELVVWPSRNNPKNILYLGQERYLSNESPPGKSSAALTTPSTTPSSPSSEVVVESNSNRNVEKAEDWVSKGLSELQTHVGDLQNWWETAKKHLNVPDAVMKSPLTQTPSSK
jgi:hypothetical protein